METGERLKNRIYINDKPVMEIDVNGKKVNYDIDAMCAQYTERGTLPTTKIVCTKTGKLITMFGENLHRRVYRFGGIRNLLTKFVCSEAGGRLPRQTRRKTLEDLQKQIERLQREEPTITVRKKQQVEH